MAIDRDKIAFASPLHPTDKVVEVIEGSYVVGATGGPTPGTKLVTVPHSQTEKCLPYVMWSTDNVNFYPGATWRYPAINGPVITAAYCTDTDVDIITGNFYITSLTIYYKVFLIWPT